MLQALGREIARVRLMGSGTLAVTTRQRQSLPPFIIDLNAPQHAVVGVDEPFLLLPVIKFKHGVKLEIIEAVHGELIVCPCTDITTRAADIISMNWKTPKTFMA